MSGYKFIEDLPENWQEQYKIYTSQMASFLQIWDEKKARLNESDSLREFNEKLTREWSIETGIIERIYNIDRSTTQTLIDKGIAESFIPHGATDKPAGIVVQILKAQQDALEGAFGFVKQDRTLSNSFIKELHAVLTRHQETTEGINTLGHLVEVPLMRGDWKNRPNNPKRPDGAIHYYAPPEQVASEMDYLIEMHKNHLEKGVPAEVEAAWLHHRFTQIHPFQDGNGRVARVLASLVFIRAGWFPLVVNRDQRNKYLDVLEKADAGDLLPLIRLFTGIQIDIFKRINELSEFAIPQNILQSQNPLERMIQAIGNQVKESVEVSKKYENERKQIQERFENLNSYLKQITETKLKSLALALNNQLKPLGSATYDTKKKTNRKLESSDHPRILIAFQKGVFLELLIEVGWIRLDEINLFEVKAFYDEEYPTTLSNSQSYGDSFEYTFNEDKELVAKRFEIWLEEKILAFLAEVEKQI
jgi:Fic family protein